eukprot:TRINITY_DN1546_c0_g1_i2.p1 TRINITY_DN1546_c0_g1~~TRINITY_DN1546_c0_g1_i2.p1  ORF type:complete len:311 (-),score=40.50 TRINITY_DN1546_c0_g1_i2:73-1005(-)
MSQGKCLIIFWKTLEKQRRQKMIELCIKTALIIDSRYTQLSIHLGTFRKSPYLHGHVYFGVTCNDTLDVQPTTKTDFIGQCKKLCWDAHQKGVSAVLSEQKLGNPDGVKPPSVPYAFASDYIEYLGLALKEIGPDQSETSNEIYPIYVMDGADPGDCYFQANSEGYYNIQKNLLHKSFDDIANLLECCKFRVKWGTSRLILRVELVSGPEGTKLTLVEKNDLVLGCMFCVAKNINNLKSSGDAEYPGCHVVCKIEVPQDDEGNENNYIASGYLRLHEKVFLSLYPDTHRTKMLRTMLAVVKNKIPQYADL